MTDNTALHLLRRVTAAIAVTALAACGSDPAENGQLDSQVEPPDPDVVETDTAGGDTAVLDTHLQLDVPLATDTGSPDVADTAMAPDTSPPPVELFRFEPTGTACETDDDCTEDGKGMCDPHFKVCVECFVKTDCGLRSDCIEYECVDNGHCFGLDECLGNPAGEYCMSHCPKDGSGVCERGRCVECVNDWHCDPLERCNNYACESDQWSGTCDEDGDCPNGGHCWLPTYRCSQCTDDAHCGPGETCSQRHCKTNVVIPTADDFRPYPHWPAEGTPVIKSLPVQLCDWQTDTGCPDGVVCKQHPAGDYCSNYAPEPPGLECWEAHSFSLAANGEDYGGHLNVTKKLTDKRCPYQYHCRADGKCYPDLCDYYDTVCAPSGTNSRSRLACQHQRGLRKVVFGECRNDDPSSTTPCVTVEDVLPLETTCNLVACADYGYCGSGFFTPGYPVPNSEFISAGSCTPGDAPDGTADNYEREICKYGEACLAGECIPASDYYGPDWPAP